MEVHLNRAPLYRPEKSFLSRKNGRIFCIYSPSDFSCAMFIQICRSPRRKRFRLVSAEQRQTEERDFRSWPRKKWSESAKMKEGGGEERKPPTNPLPALLLAPFFARSLTLVPRSLLRNCTETLATQAYYAGKPATNGLEPDKNGRTLFLLGHMIKAAICCVESQLK